MMSLNVLHHASTKCPKPSSIDLKVETLMGTSFEIKVCGHDTITMVKSKIQTAEGIPSSQQHLLYNMKELEDKERICSYPILSGTTLKLIVSMRVGPISTKRAPEVDELAWRELQELISDTPKDDLISRLPPKTRLTVLIFQDGEQVNFLKVLENEDGTFSPLADAWNGSSFRTLFSKTNALPEDSEERLEDNSVTMGKVQELQERLEALSIHNGDRRADHPFEIRPTDPAIASRTFGSKTDSQRSVRVVSYLSGGLPHHSGAVRLFRRQPRDADDADVQRTRVLFPSLFYPKMFMNKNRIKKEVERMTQFYKAKRIPGSASECSSGCGLKRPPLPEIRRSSPSDKEKVACDEEKLDDKLREKTATSFAIVEEENAVSSAPISQSSVVALPATDETAAAVALSPVSADRVTPTVSRSIYKVSSYVLKDNESPGTGKAVKAKLDEGKGAKTEPGTSKAVKGKLEEGKGAKTEPGTGKSVKGKGKLDEGKGAKTDSAKGATKESKPSTSSKQKPINYPRLFRRLSRMVPVTKVIAIENGKEKEVKPEEYAPPIVRYPPKEEEPVQQPAVKKRVRCTECKKKLNITNTYYCRCGDGPFCGEHRYSEAHDCAIDYRLQGRRVIRKANPVIAPSKLPRI